VVVTVADVVVDDVLSLAPPPPQEAAASARTMSIEVRRMACSISMGESRWFPLSFPIGRFWSLAGSSVSLSEVIHLWVLPS